MKAKKKHSKPKKFRILHKKEDFEQDLAADQIIVVWFSSQHNYAFLWRFILTSTGPNLGTYRFVSWVKERKYKRKTIKEIASRGSEGSIGFSQSAGRKPGGLCPSENPLSW
jgi:hypothetical protein